MSRYPPDRRFWDGAIEPTYGAGCSFSGWMVRPINERALDAAMRRFPALCRAWRLEEEWLHITRNHIEILMAEIRDAYREELANAAA